MHDDFSMSCGHCKKFNFVFAAGSPLAKWGLCRDEFEGLSLGEESRRDLELAMLSGDKVKIYKTKGLYEEDEEGCPQFEPR